MSIMFITLKNKKIKCAQQKDMAKKFQCQPERSGLSRTFCVGKSVLPHTINSHRPHVAIKWQHVANMIN